MLTDEQKAQIRKRAETAREEDRRNTRQAVQLDETINRLAGGIVERAVNANQKVPPWDKAQSRAKAALEQRFKAPEKPEEFGKTLVAAEQAASQQLAEEDQPKKPATPAVPAAEAKTTKK